MTTYRFDIITSRDSLYKREYIKLPNKTEAEQMKKYFLKAYPECYVDVNKVA